jgi:hypothetical protein
MSRAIIQAAVDETARALLTGETVKSPAQTLRIAAGMIAVHFPGQDRRAVEAAVAMEFNERLTIALRGLDDDAIAEHMRVLFAAVAQTFPSLN